MIKLSFKMFGCLSVLLFFGFAGIYIAMSTMPPPYIVRAEIREEVYPVAREHLKEKFNRFVEDTRKTVNVGIFSISEIEINAWINKLLVDNLTVGGAPLFKYPYLFVNKGNLVFRVDVPFATALKMISNKFAGYELKENIDRLTPADKDAGTVSFTFVLNAYWIDKEQRPYLYLDRFYIGVMPVPIPIFMSDYQDQFNRFLEDALYKMVQLSPVLVRKIEVRYKGIDILTELKVTDAVAMETKMTRWKKANPEIASAMDKKDCLYGCTEEEYNALKKWMKKSSSLSANDISMEDMAFYKLVNSTMKSRRYKMTLDSHGKSNWKRVIENFDDGRDWGIKNLPPDMTQEDLYKYNR